jgi:hypothetical protein
LTQKSDTGTQWGLSNGAGGLVPNAQSVSAAAITTAYIVFLRLGRSLSSIATILALFPRHPEGSVAHWFDQKQSRLAY